MDLVLSFSLHWIWFCLAFLEALLFIYSAEVKKIRLSWSKLSAFAINCRDVCVTSPRACWKCISLHNSVFWGRAVRCSAGLGFSMSAFLLAAYAQGASRGQNCAKGTSFHFYDFPWILWRAWKDRHVYEGFQMVRLAPPAFLFSSWAMKD